MEKIADGRGGAQRRYTMTGMVEMAGIVNHGRDGRWQRPYLFVMLGQWCVAEMGEVDEMTERAEMAEKAHRWRRRTHMISFDATGRDSSDGQTGTLLLGRKRKQQ